MRISILQTDITWASPQANHTTLDGMVAALPQADLIVLPEMFSTGFCTQPQGVAEPDTDGPSLTWMRATAARHDCAVAGSVAVTDGTRFYNRFYFVTPDGAERHYDKHHLFTYGGEHLTYTPGNERVVVEWRDARILLLVCYDLRFPGWSRNSHAAPYDLCLYVASWPKPRQGAWDTLLRARAIENQCYVAGVNRVGSDPTCQYTGGTALIDPYGQPLATTEYGKVQAVTADIDLGALAAFRQKFPVLNDAD